MVGECVSYCILVTGGRGDVFVGAAPLVEAGGRRRLWQFTHAKSVSLVAIRNILHNGKGFCLKTVASLYLLVQYDVKLMICMDTARER